MQGEWCECSAVLGDMKAVVSGVWLHCCVEWDDCSGEQCERTAVLGGLRAVLSDGKSMLSEC